MSHFTVLVIGKDVERQLAKYDENKGVKPYKVYLTKKDIKRMTDHYKISPKSKEDIIGKMEDWNGDKGGKDKKGFYRLSTYNKFSKWDWYQTGGRWAGMLQLKPGKTGIQGEKSWCNDKKEIPINMVDIALKGDVDWEAMKNDPKGIQSLKDEWKKGVIEKKGWYKPEYYIKKYGTLEQYIKEEMLFHTYAVVLKGKWYSPGDMGWFGMSNETIKQDRKWKLNYWKKFLEPLADNILLSVVDCHI